jgi:selenocysteine-specific elongation factor
VGFVDVPGHERFVKNMLAGVGGIDAVLLAVAADESAMPQTREHLAICDLLGVEAGVVAITKCDLADEEMLELVELEIIELLEGTRLEGSPVVRTSATTGAGMDELVGTLANLLRGLDRARPTEIMRLPIDRVFSVRGFGTVVTGTLLAGSIQPGDRLEVLPQGSHATVRGVQIHGRDAEAAMAGQRAAVNLQGVAAEDLSRGMMLAPTGALAPASVLDLRVDMLPGYRLEHHQRVRFHHGAAELLGRVVLLEGDELDGTGYAQIRLESPYPAIPGDRVVLRRYSPVETIGGALVIDPRPPKRRRGAAAAAAIARLDGASDLHRCRRWILDAGARGLGEHLLAQRAGRAAHHLDTVLSELDQADDLVRVPASPPLWIGRVHIDEAAAVAQEILRQFHAQHPLRQGLEHGRLRSSLGDLAPAAVDHTLEELAAAGTIVAGDGFAALATHEIELATEILAAVGSPALADELLHLLLRTGELVRLNDQYVVAAAALEKLVEQLRARAGENGTFSIADFKEWTGLSRRHSIPILEHLDRSRVTRRAGDDRILT